MTHQNPNPHNPPKPKPTQPTYPLFCTHSLMCLSPRPRTTVCRSTLHHCCRSWLTRQAFSLYIHLLWFTHHLRYSSFVDRRMVVGFESRETQWHLGSGLELGLGHGSELDDMHRDWEATLVVMMAVRLNGARKLRIFRLERGLGFKWKARACMRRV